MLSHCLIGRFRLNQRKNFCGDFKIQKIRLKFVDFWPKFGFQWFDPFYTILNDLYDVQIVDSNPDFLFFSVFGNEYLEYEYDDVTKLFYSAEVRDPLDIRKRFARADYSFSFHSKPNNDNHVYLPSWIMWRGYDNLYDLTQPRNPDKILNGKSKFCNFLYSNPKPWQRKKFFKELNKYKKVDSGGSVFNNIDYDVGRGKCIEWTRDYKFNIAFENQMYPGYVTEKILRAFLAQTIPIYWGSDSVLKDFNPDSFVYVEGMDDVCYYVDKVKELEQNDSKYKAVISQSPFRGNQIPKQWRRETLEEKFREVFECGSSGGGKGTKIGSQS